MPIFASDTGTESEPFDVAISVHSLADLGAHSVATARAQNSTLILLSVRGTLDCRSVPPVDRILGPPILEGDIVTLDLREVQFVDYAALGFLIALRRRLGRNGLFLVVRQGCYTEMALEQTRLSRLIRTLYVEQRADELAVASAVAMKVCRRRAAKDSAPFPLVTGGVLREAA